MTNEELKKLEDDLWDSANNFRANSGLKSSEYATPVLGLIFLRFVSNRYKQFEPEIRKEIEAQKNSRIQLTLEEVAVKQCRYYLPESAKYDYLLNLPEDGKIREAIQSAMKSIEAYTKELEDVLPFNEYAPIKDDVCKELLKTFADIPEDATGDIFGKIYEYFLGKFALSEGQKGGEFFTPTSVVKLIVEIIEPYQGSIYDPACGSGGMFVQSAKFVERHKKELRETPDNDLFIYGQEKTEGTVKLAKMNIFVNGLRGEIIKSNTYEEDIFNSFGKFDYVMANPPFNVKDVNEDSVKDDKRFNAYGLPKSSNSKNGKGKATIPNANYLWINLFATSLKDNPPKGRGRAGLVMANSASDARHSEADIRQTLIGKGIIDVMISLPSNMFFTVTLPATLWFFDKAKTHKDKILFIDARNIYRQIDRAHREFAEEQIFNLAVIVRLYRGEDQRFLKQIDRYFDETRNWSGQCKTQIQQIDAAIAELIKGLKLWYDAVKGKFDKERAEKATTFGFDTKLSDAEGFIETSRKAVETDKGLSGEVEKAFQAYQEKVRNQDISEANTQQRAFSETFLKQTEHFRRIADDYETDVKSLEEIVKFADKHLKLKADKDWSKHKVIFCLKCVGEEMSRLSGCVEQHRYFYEQIRWLQERFPEARYNDVAGLCKLADIAEIEKQDYSLNPGRYVGVVAQEDDEADFTEQLQKLNQELELLNTEAGALERKIQQNISGLLSLN